MIRAPDKCIRSFLGDSNEVEQGKWRMQDGVLSLCSLRAALYDTKCVPKLKEVTKAKAPDQAKMPPSQKDWGVCLSLLSVQCPGGSSLLVCQEKNLSKCHSPMGPRNASPPPPIPAPEPGDEGVFPEGTYKNWGIRFMYSSPLGTGTWEHSRE